jgi:hypothetical protein
VDILELGQNFTKHFGFALSVMNPPMLHGHLSLGTGSIDQFRAAVPWESVSLHSYNLKETIQWIEGAATPEVK